jgi:hypothetical protein
MEKSLAKAVLPLANDAQLYSVLQMYIQARINVMRGYLENSKEHHKILEIQGAIAELRRFETLREQAIEGAKNG